LNGMRTIKVKAEPFFATNRSMAWNCPKCSSSNFSLGQMLPFNLEMITNVVDLLLSKQTYTHEFKEQIQGDVERCCREML
jgi:hypothetical protein